MNNIKEYTFVDCIMVDFLVDKLLSTLCIVTEAYYPLSNSGTRQKGLIKISFKGLTEVLVRKNEEFEDDISLPYNKHGDDVKANEIYSFEIHNLQNKSYKGIINSDMLNLELKFKNFNIEEIN